MTQLDWYFAVANFLWILGLSTILAASSYHLWLCQEARRPFARLFREHSWRLAFDAGLSLVAVSIAVMPRSERWWTRAIALSFALLFLTLARGVIQAWRQNSRTVQAG